MLKANKGDLVRILEGADVRETELSVGDIVEISHVNADFARDNDYSEYYVRNHQFKSGNDVWLCEGEFELFRKAGEEDDPKRVYVKALDEEGGKFVSEAEYNATYTEDAVHHPSHYTQGKFETIEIIEAITQGYDDGYVAYSVGNALKYLARAPFKHASPLEDLRKAATYLEFAIKAYEAKEAN